MAGLWLGAAGCGGTTDSREIGASRDAAGSPDGSPASSSFADVSVLDDAGASPSPLLVGDGAVSSLISGDGSALTASSITVTIRDFKFWDSADNTTNPDFEHRVVGDDHGNIVSSTLGADHKPVYKNPTGTTATTHGKKYFDQWYNDVPGTNVNVQYPITLTLGGQGTYGYDSQISGVFLSRGDPRRMWFPIDDGTPFATPFGNQGQPHNYSFTTELHTVFVYRGGETFSFTGDDDVFVFIDDKLVIDLGGIHFRELGVVQLDALGLVKGRQYALDLFDAERHMVESNFSFTTTLQLQAPPK